MVYKLDSGSIPTYIRVVQETTVMADAAAGIASVLSTQAILSTLTTLSLTEFRYPQDAGSSVYDGAFFDFIVIGSGAGGSPVASRLSEDNSVNVLLVECGGYAPMESDNAGMLTSLPNTKHDWNQTTQDDNWAAQNMVDGIIQMTSGKVLGGTSCVDHMVYVRGVAADYDEWALKTNDSGWSSSNILEYFKKSEQCLVSDILEEYSSFHGTTGPLGLTRETSEYNIPILEALAEAGQPTITDITAFSTPLGYGEPMLLINDLHRQNAAAAYLGPAKNRSNLYVKINTCATKINFDSNNKAISVDLSTSDGETMTVNVTKEVIVSGGVVRSPQLLMNSGIGPKAHLEEMGIEVLLDLPVGQNLTDQHAAFMVYTLGESNRTVVSNPFKFPAPVTVGSGALNKSADRPDYQSIHLVFEPKSTGIKQMCSWVFKYTDDICQYYIDANQDREVLFLAHYLLHAKSRGQVLLNSTDPAVAPIVELGLYSNEEDLDNMAEYLVDFGTIVNSTYFQSIGSELIDPNLTKCQDYEKYSQEYMKCYALEMSSTTWHYSGTCAMGTVLDSNLKVKGVSNVRVVDASAMPTTISGKIISAIYALSERAADLIKADWDLS